MSRIHEALCAANLRMAGEPFTTERRASVPHLEAFDKWPALTLNVSPESRIAFLEDAHGIVTEQYRRLARNLEEAYPQGCVLLVTSPGKGDGKTMTSANLSWALAENKMTTVLVEADLRSPAIGLLLGCKPDVGVESAFMREITPPAALRSTGIPHLYAALVAHPPKDVQAVLKSEGVSAFIKWARRNFRWTILDTPALLPVADVLDFAPYADAIVLVVRTRATTKGGVASAFEILGGRLKAVILNDTATPSDRYYRGNGYGKSNGKAESKA